MGYFSKKKHNERRQFFLKSTLLVVLAFIFLLFLDERYGFFVEFVSKYAFQISFLILFVAVYSFVSAKWLYGLFFGASFVLCLGVFSSSTNLFKNTQISQGQDIKIDLQSTGNFNTQNTSVVREGILHFGTQHQGYFKVIRVGEDNVTLIGVNFSQVKTKNIEKYFNSLRQFVLEQNNPVIVFGEFGVPAWFKVFRQFLNDTGLRAKNKIFLKSPLQKFNLLCHPQFYVLAFSNTGLSEVDFFATTQSTKISAIIK